MTPRLAVFDLDGTLIDSRLDLAAAVNAMRANHHLLPLELETVVSYVGNGIQNLIRRSLLDANEVPLDQAIAEMKRYYNRHLVDHTMLYPGVRDGLEKLAQSNWRLAVVTNKDSDSATQILEKLGVAAYLSEIIGGSDRFPLKPAPDALLYLCSRYNVLPGNAFMVGDHYTDLAAGHAAGMRGIYAAYGFGNPRDEVFEKRIDSFADFVAYSELTGPNEGDLRR